MVLSERNAWAFQHYQSCAAVNWNVPEAVTNDPIVQRNARIIKGVLDDYHEAQQQKIGSLLSVFLSTLAAQR